MRLKTFGALVAVAAILSGVRAPHFSGRVQLPRLLEGTALQATYIPTPIKSLTPISITISAASTSNTQTVSVTAANSLLIATGISDNNVLPPDSGWAKGTITSGVTITATRIASVGAVTYTATLVEFIPQFVKSQGCNAIDLADTVASNTATITSVNTAKTLLAHTGVTSTVGSGVSLTVNNAQLTTLTQTNATTITVTRGVTSGEVNTGYCYLETR